MQEHSVSLFDVSRNRTLAVQAYLPNDQSASPTIIFSHGVGGSKNSYTYLGRSLAERGIACFHPTHPGSDASILIGKRYSENREHIFRAVTDPANYQQRALDIQFILNELTSLEKKLNFRCDFEKISVAGHSFGAVTALQLAGASISIDGKRWFCKDERCSSFIALSPPYVAKIFDEISWREVRGPLLAITGTRDEGLLKEPAQHRIDAFRTATPGDKWLMVIEDATHLSFVDAVPFNDLPHVREIVQQVTYDFLVGTWNNQLSNVIDKLSSSRIKVFTPSPAERGRGLG